MVFHDLLSHVFTPGILFTCFTGVVVGTILGALPGLTATMGITLIIPFTYNLDTFHSFALLLGVYVSGIYGGSISATLIRTPGTPSSAATILDAYPMAQHGEAGRAIGICTMASFFGGIFSAVCLVMIAPILSRYALRFGPPEFFGLAAFGLTIIVTVSEKNLLKGAISGLLGLWFATFGIDPILGYPRFTFGMPELLGGINFVVALIGLFAIGEVLTGIDKLGEVPPVNQKLSGIFASLRDLMKNSLYWLSSAIIGTFVGVLPGVGSTIAPWISYDMAKRLDRGRSPFGTGIPKGIIASETANNACTGGAMITMLSLGLPGDVITAILIGALLIQGLRPGPRLFAESPDLVYGIIALMFIANFFMGLVGLFGARFFAKVVSIPQHILLPLIVVFSVLGAFAINNDPFDIWLMLGFGVLGYLMRKWDCPPAPLILGMVLGPIAESQFRRSLVISNGDYLVFLTHPISAVLIYASIASLTFPLISAWVRKRKSS